jgi:hypothetical protein
LASRAGGTPDTSAARSAQSTPRRSLAPAANTSIATKASQVGHCSSWLSTASPAARGGAGGRGRGSDPHRLLYPPGELPAERFEDDAAIGRRRVSRINRHFVRNMRATVARQIRQKDMPERSESAVAEVERAAAPG